MHGQVDDLAIRRQSKLSEFIVIMGAQYSLRTNHSMQLALLWKEIYAAAVKLRKEKGMHGMDASKDLMKKIRFAFNLLPWS